MEEIKAIEKKEKSEALTMQPSYKNFVEYGKILIRRIERNELELARLCYRANQELADTPGYRSDLAKKAISSSEMQTLSHVRQGSEAKTFKDFCEDIGISRATGYRAVASYNAEKDRLYTKDEMKEMAEAAWNALCKEIHHHRTHGEPLWKPEKWNGSLEFRYEEWLVQHGFKAQIKVDPSILSVTGLPSAGYPSFGPFTFEFIDYVGHYCIEETRGEGAVRFFDMCQRYKSSVPKGIEPNSVLRIPVMVKGAISQLPAEARRDATILVANILRDYVEGEV